MTGYSEVSRVGFTVLSILLPTNLKVEIGGGDGGGGGGGGDGGGGGGGGM